MPTLRKLASNFNLFQLKGHDLALSNDMHVFLQNDVNRVSHFEFGARRLTSTLRCNTRCIILIDQFNIT